MNRTECPTVIVVRSSTDYTTQYNFEDSLALNKIMVLFDYIFASRPVFFQLFFFKQFIDATQRAKATICYRRVPKQIKLTSLPMCGTTSGNKKGTHKISIFAIILHFFRLKLN